MIRTTDLTIYGQGNASLYDEFIEDSIATL